MGCNSKLSEREGNIAKISFILSFSSPFLQGIFLMLSSAKQDCMDCYLFENPARKGHEKFPSRAITKKIISTWGVSWVLWAHKKVQYLLLYSITLTLALIFCLSLKYWFWHFSSRMCCLVCQKGTSMSSGSIEEVKFYCASPTFKKFCIVKFGINVYSKFHMYQTS